ncbi:MAG TPA: thymidylate synthase [Balneola sp.]|jgi:thymidylate synthase|nr:thymidylate synthase [Balneola sp.]HAW81969.1 thymidylate synthase [Balneola sp.]HBZ39961.1 thymidylate synthase [Balneola sp.]|tara:strand:+ start:1609 stop:2457 length:849 start_codon:yes stop_codon:yes gene_type:complete
MKAYLDLVKNVLENGVRKENRTGTDTISNFAEFYKVDLSEGFPLLTTKKVFFRSVILELLWYLRGEDHIRWLRDENDCHIWDAWADEDGHVGPIYPVLWRKFPYLEKEKVKLEGSAGAVESETWVRKEFDQVQRAIDMLKTNPNSRRIVVSTWHPGLLGEMALPPCHIMYIFNVSNGKLNCHLTQRSGDIALGIPFNLACYSALTMAIAQEVGLEPGTFAHTIVDAHIYVNHVDGLKEQLKREPRELPTLEIAKKPVDELTFDDFKLHGYDPDPVIKFEVAV